MRHVIISAIIISTFLSPGFKLHPNLPLVYLHDPIVSGVIIYLLFIKIQSIKNLFFSSYYKYLSIPYLLLLIYTLIITSLYVIVGESDFYLIVSVLGRFKPFFLGIAVFALIKKDVDLKVIAACMLLVISVEIVFMFMQRYNLLDINNWLSPLYIGISREERLATLLRNNRVIGTFGNPNMMATVITVIGIFAFAGAIFYKKKVYRLISAIYTILLLYACVFLTQSRQGIVTLIIGITFVVMISFFVKGRKIWTATILSIIVSIIAFFITTINIDSKTAERFGFLYSETKIIDTGSLTHRLEYTWPQQWQKLKDEQGFMMIFGAGKRADFVGWDSGFLNTFEEAGIIGIIGLIFITFLPSFATAKMLIRCKLDVDYYALFVACTAMSIPLFLTTAVNSTWNNHNVMSAIVIVYAIVLGAMAIVDKEYDITLQIKGKQSNIDWFDKNSDTHWQAKMRFT